MTFSVGVDWNKDGDFTDPGEDVTADVRDQVQVSYGREAGGAEPVTAGSGGVVLDNTTRRYSPRNTGSLLYGNLKPGRPVKITRTVGATTYTQFRGRTDESPINPETASKRIGLSLVDQLADFRGQTISTLMYRGISTGQAVGYVLDAVGWTGARDIDPGATIIPWWWEDNTDALTALSKIVNSEGFPAKVEIGASGEFVFRDRFHRHTRAESTTSQGTWRASGNLEPVMQSPFSYDDAWPNIVNTAYVQVETRMAQQSQLIWQSDGPIEMPLDTTRVISPTISDPFINAYLVYDLLGPTQDLISFWGTITLTRTSGGSTDIIIDCDSGYFGVNLSRRIASMRLYAQPVPVVSTQTVTGSDSASIAAYGPRSFTVELPWCGVNDVRAIVDRVIADRAQPLPVVEASFMVGRDATKAAAILSRDLSDRVTIVEPETALNDPFHLERIQHTFTGEHDHTVTFTAERVPPTTYPNLFILGTSVLNTGTLG